MPDIRPTTNTQVTTPSTPTTPTSVGSNGIASFYEALNTKGVFHPYRFKVSIHSEIANKIMNNPSLDTPMQQIEESKMKNDLVASEFVNDDGKFTFFAQSTAIPGRSLTEIEAHFLGMTFVIPYNMTYEKQISLNMICDSKLLIRDFCESWMDYHGSLEKASGGVKGLSDFSVELGLLKTSLDNNDVMKYYVLNGCWPKTIGDITLDHTGTGHSTFNFIIAYQWYETMSASIKGTKNERE